MNIKVIIRGFKGEQVYYLISFMCFIGQKYYNLFKAKLIKLRLYVIFFVFYVCQLRDITGVRDFKCFFSFAARTSR